MQGNILGNNGSLKKSSLLNVYQQNSTPSKDGLWIKTNDKEQYLSLRDDITYKTQKLNDAPFDLDSSKTVVKNNNIYITDDDYLYCYDIFTQTYTKLQKMPSDYRISYGDVVLLNNSIYMFGSTLSSNSKDTAENVFVYDILNQSYVQLNNLPYNFGDGKATIANGEIYLMNFDYIDEFINDIYKYNVEEDSYTKVTTIPYNFCGTGGSQNNIIEILGINEEIYLFGGTDINQKNTYKYNVNQNSFTKLTDMPIESFNISLTLVEKEIFIFYPNKIGYKYKIEEDEFEKLHNINFDSDINLITFELDIFGFERKDLSYKVYKYGLNLDSECLNVHVQDILFNVQDRLEFLNKIKKVYKNKNDIAYSQEAYIPNGTEWKKLE